MSKSINTPLPLAVGVDRMDGHLGEWQLGRERLNPHCRFLVLKERERENLRRNVLSGNCDQESKGGGGGG